MKKLLIYIIILSLSVFCLAGCALRSDAGTDAAAPVEQVEDQVFEPTAVRVGALTGPTAMGMAKFFKDLETEEYSNAYEYTLAGSADELTPLLLQGKLDIASVPVNLASVLYNKTEGGVRMLAVDVLGVLCIGEFNGDTVSDISDLRGQTLYASGKGSVPEYFLRYILSENGIDPDKDVVIEWKSEPGEIVALLNAQQRGIAMLPQPYASAAAIQLGEGYKNVLSVSDEWAKLDNGTSCTTAGIVVRTDFAEQHPEAVEEFLRQYSLSASWVNENADEAAVLCDELGIAKAPVAKLAIPECNIVCLTGDDMQSALSGCLGVLYGYDPASVGGALPGEDFYY